MDLRGDMRTVLLAILLGLVSTHAAEPKTAAIPAYVREAALAKLNEYCDQAIRPGVHQQAPDGGPMCRSFRTPCLERGKLSEADRLNGINEKYVGVIVYAKYGVGRLGWEDMQSVFTVTQDNGKMAVNIDAMDTSSKCGVMVFH
jgi:hypothetical protein